MTRRDSRDDDFDDEVPTNPALWDPRARVLVVEDDECLRELLVMRLRRDAFEVLEAGSGDEALRVMRLIASQLSPELDLLVIDVRMPGTSGPASGNAAKLQNDRGEPEGLEVVRMLRRAGDAIPVVGITAFPEPDVIVEAARLDMVLLAKPFALDRFSDAAIEALLVPRQAA